MTPNTSEKMHWCAPRERTARLTSTVKDKIARVLVWILIGYLAVIVGYLIHGYSGHYALAIVAAAAVVMLFPFLCWSVNKIFS